MRGTNTNLEEELLGKLERSECKKRLLVSIVDPILSYIWCSIVQHHISLGRLQILLEVSPGLLRGDVPLEADGPGARLDREKVNTNDQAREWHAFFGNLGLKY